MNSTRRFSENPMDASVVNAKEEGHCSWQSPSNIALVKYWGKKDEQIPCNPSISFTLNKAHTSTDLKWNRKKNSSVKRIDFEFLFHGVKNDKFNTRIQKYLERLAKEMPVLLEYHLKISSKNTFPHSSGIASSASAMSALCATLVDMESQIMGNHKMDNNESIENNHRISHFSRLGSGSACRSIYPNAALWGKCSFPNSSDEYAVSLETILHPQFHGYKDAILLVDQSEKKVSSSAGHQLMNGNPYADVRYAGARNNTETMLSILKSGELDDFTSLVEQEAMILHALMMASSPGYILMHPNTLHIIDKVRKFRKDTNIPVCFTLDAGPNVHLLYPNTYSKSVKDFIQTDLLTYCHKEQWIDDEMGKGIQRWHQ